MHLSQRSDYMEIMQNGTIQSSTIISSMLETQKPSFMWRNIEESKSWTCQSNKQYAMSSSYKT